MPEVTQNVLLDETIGAILIEAAEKLEERLEGDVISYIGTLEYSILNDFRNFIEGLEEGRKPRLVFFITTVGGVVQAAEKIVEIVRHHYSEVYFVVPDYAMSAGTVLVMSGDEIYMDYTSSLGPIDPQVVINGPAGQQFVPALGYLDKVEELIAKSAEGKITAAEFSLLQGQDLALLRSYEQARDLSKHLLAEWLFEYKFRAWKKHSENSSRRGKTVSKEHKMARARKIADQLCDNNIWHSHGRLIGLRTLEVLRLKIEDYTADNELRDLIRRYHDTLSEYVGRMQRPFCLHSARRSTI